MEFKKPTAKRIWVKGHCLSKDQHDLLTKYFSVDDDKGIVTATVRFDSFDEMLNPNLGDQKERMLSEEVKDSIERVFKIVPRFYKVAFDFHIGDFGHWTLDDAYRIFDENTKLWHWNTKRSLSWKSKGAIVLTLVGFIVLVINAMFVAFHWGDQIENGPLKEIISEILDIAAWVFIWEAVTLYFIDRNQIKFKEGDFRRRIARVDFHHPSIVKK